jgi:hypothetical protein
MTSDAYEVGNGAFSGQTSPGHNYRKVNGVKHSTYTQKVRDQLDKYMKNVVGPNKKMTAEQMKQFAERMEKGLDWSGKKAVDELRQFNDGIRAERTAWLKSNPKVRPRKPPSSVEELQQEGRRYLSRNGRTGVGMRIATGLLAGALLDALSEQVSAMDSIAEDPGFSMAIESLQNGDLHGAETQLFGDGGEYPNGGVAGRLMDKGLGRAASKLHADYLKMREKALADGATAADEYLNSDNS